MYITDVAVISHIAGINSTNGLKLRLPFVSSFTSSVPSYRNKITIDYKCTYDSL